MQVIMAPWNVRPADLEASDQEDCHRWGVKALLTLFCAQAHSSCHRVAHWHCPLPGPFPNPTRGRQGVATGVLWAGLGASGLQPRFRSICKHTPAPMSHHLCLRPSLGPAPYVSGATTRRGLEDPSCQLSVKAHDP